MIARVGLGETRAEWCSRQSAWNPIAWFGCFDYDAAHVAADIYSGARYGSTYETPPPVPQAPTIRSIDPATGAVVMATPQQEMATYKGQVDKFFSQLATDAETAQCSRPWSVFDSSCSPYSWVFWAALVVFGLMLLRGGSR